MKLLYTKRSPYARKVRVLALEKDIKLDLVEEDLAQKSERLIKANPLGKIPALLLDSGETICDSPVICEYLDALKGPALIPPEGPDRFKVLTLASIADGLMDIAVAAYLEKVRHPDNSNTAFIKNQEDGVRRTLALLETRLGELQKLSLASIAVACAVAYVNFRLPHAGPAHGHPKLAAWLEEFSRRPSMQQTQPS